MWKTWSLGRIFGVDLKIHSTFLLLLAFVALSGFFRGGTVQGLLGVGLALIVFSVVVLHEFGHIFAARFFGFKTKDIILSPIGGMARLQGMPDKPRQEMIVAAAGPAVNLVLAALSWGALAAVPWAQMGAAGPFSAALTDWFMVINLVLLGFNLLPALPMDGGRILRAALAHKHGHLVATQKAAKVARWTALGMVLFGLFTGRFMLVIVAGFVFVMSWFELGHAYFKQAQRQGQRPQFHPGADQVIVDQYGRPIGGAAGRAWDSAQDANDWSVKSVKWAD